MYDAHVKAYYRHISIEASCMECGCSLRVHPMTNLDWGVVCNRCYDNPHH